MTEELGFIGKAIVYAITGAPVLTSLFLMGCNIAHLPPFQKKITSRAELERVVKEEAEKLGLDSSKIDLKYDEQRFSSEKVGDRYNLHLQRGNFLATKKIVKHELCHIKEDCDKPITEFYYNFIAEPRATLYGTFGIKI